MQSTMQGAKWCPKYEPPVPGALHPRWKEYNLLSQHKWTNTALIWLLFGCRVDPVENATHALRRGTLETSVGRGAQTGVDSIIQTAAVCPSAQPLILTSLNQLSSLSNQVPVIRSCFLLLC